MTWKQIDALITIGLSGAAVGSVLDYPWGTLIGLAFGIWVAVNTEEYKKDKNAKSPSSK